jgi:hypothetical protein
MVGKSIVRKGAYVISAIAVLFLSSEIFSSIVFIVTTFRSGNALPSLTVTVSTIVSTRFAAMSLREPNETLVFNIISWILTFYLSFIASLLVVSYGLAAALVAFFGVILVMYLVREPPIARTALTEIFGFGRELVDAALLGNSVEKWAMRAFRNLTAIVFPEKSLEDIVGFVHDHPEFNLTILRSRRYVLIVSKENRLRVLSLLHEREIELDIINNLLVNWAILHQIPVVNKQFGKQISDYGVVRNATPEQFLSLQSSDCALYSHTGKLYILLPTNTTDTMRAKPIPSGLEARIVTGRDGSALEKRWSGGVF